MAKKDSETATDKVATVRLVNPEVKKHSVKFDADTSETEPILTGAYIMKNAAKEFLGVDLETVKVLEVSVRVVE